MTKLLSPECEYIIRCGYKKPHKDTEVPPFDFISDGDNYDATTANLEQLESQGYIICRNVKSLMWRTLFNSPQNAATPPQLTVVDRTYRTVELTLRGRWYHWVHLRC